jgi:general secretion pathway protein C
MRTSLLNFWTVRLITFLLWSLAAASAAFWILQNINAMNAAASDASSSSAKAAVTRIAAPSLTPQVATALGAKNAAASTPASELTALQARLQLQGVLAVGTKRGAALISVDGKPAKPYRVGAAIEDGLEVTAVGAREASIGTNGQAAFTLALPLQK